jgi:hypothetical protein
MVGPDGGNVQTDIWELIAATELLNLISWSWTTLEAAGETRKASKPVYNILLL